MNLWIFRLRGKRSDCNGILTSDVSPEVVETLEIIEILRKNIRVSYGGPISAPDISSECCRPSFILSMVWDENRYMSFSNRLQIKAGPSKGVAGAFS